MNTAGKTKQIAVPIGRIALFFLCLFLLSISGCGKKRGIVSIRAEQYKVYSYQHSDSRAKVALLKKQYSKWRGTKYKSGGMSRSGIDCSGFSVVTYRDLFGIQLPRTTGGQAETGRPVSKSALNAGDLIFFKTGVWQKHVGIYIEQGRFVHVSTTKGVMISNLKDSYWKKHYWRARRL
jgi:probable lipoprotein NlpC